MDDVLSGPVVIDETAATLIRKNFHLYAALALVSSAVALVALTAQCISYHMYSRVPVHRVFDLIKFRLYPVVGILMIVLNIAAIYFYYNGQREQSRGADQQQASLYHSGLNKMIRGSILFLVVSGLSLLVNFLFLWQALTMDHIL